jgi:Ca2+-dependent lipid-binding protein
MGILGVELIDAKGLQGSDRSGKSDVRHRRFRFADWFQVVNRFLRFQPYVVFTLGGDKIFKSQVKKKTLMPTWNERFEAVVKSRSSSKLTFEIFDWNQVRPGLDPYFLWSLVADVAMLLLFSQIESAKSLGTGSVDLVSIEPFEASEVTLPVMTAKDGVRGTLRLRMVFTPQLIARVRRHTGTLSAAGRTLSTVGSTVGAAPIMVGKGVGHGLVAGGTGVVHGVGAVGTGVVHGVGAVGGFAGRKVGLIKKKDKQGNEVLVEEPLEEGGYELVNPKGHARNASHKGSLAPSSAPTGRISITCLRAKGISGTASGDVKPYIVLQTDKQKHHTHHAKKSEEPEW